MGQAFAAAQDAGPAKSQGMSHRPAGPTALPASIADSGTPDAGTSAQSACTYASEDSSSSQECTSPAQRRKLWRPQQDASLAGAAEIAGLLTGHCHQQVARTGIMEAAAAAQGRAAGHSSGEATGLKVLLGKQRRSSGWPADLIDAPEGSGQQKLQPALRCVAQSGRLAPAAAEAVPSWPALQTGPSPAIESWAQLAHQSVGQASAADAVQAACRSMSGQLQSSLSMSIDEHQLPSHWPTAGGCALAPKQAAGDTQTRGSCAVAAETQQRPRRSGVKVEAFGGIEPASGTNDAPLVLESSVHSGGRSGRCANGSASGTSEAAAAGPRRSQRPTRAPCSLAACVQVGQLYVSQGAPAPAAGAPVAPPPQCHGPTPSVGFPAGSLAAGGPGVRPASSWASSLAASRLTGSNSNSSSLGALQWPSRALGPRLVLGKPTGSPMSRLGRASRQVRGAMVEQGSRKVAIKSPHDSAAATAAVGVRLAQTAAPAPPPAAKSSGSKPAKGAVPGSRSGRRKKPESTGGQHQLDGLGPAVARAATVCSVQLLEYLYGAGKAPAGFHLAEACQRMQQATHPPKAEPGVDLTGAHRWPGPAPLKAEPGQPASTGLPGADAVKAEEKPTPQGCVQEAPLEGPVQHKRRKAEPRRQRAARLGAVGCKPAAEALPGSQVAAASPGAQPRVPGGPAPVQAGRLRQKQHLPTGDHAGPCPSNGAAWVSVGPAEVPTSLGAGQGGSLTQHLAAEGAELRRACSLEPWPQLKPSRLPAGAAAPAQVRQSRRGQVLVGKPVPKQEAPLPVAKGELGPTGATGVAPAGQCTLGRHRAPAAGQQEAAKRRVGKRRRPASAAAAAPDGELASSDGGLLPVAGRSEAGPAAGRKRARVVRFADEAGGSACAPPKPGLQQPNDSASPSTGQQLVEAPVPVPVDTLVPAEGCGTAVARPSSWWDKVTATEPDCLRLGTVQLPKGRRTGLQRLAADRALKEKALREKALRARQQQPPKPALRAGPGAKGTASKGVLHLMGPICSNAKPGPAGQGPVQYSPEQLSRLLTKQGRKLVSINKLCQMSQ